MSEDSNRQDCDEYSDDLAELALGILTGRARAATLGGGFDWAALKRDRDEGRP